MTWPGMTYGDLIAYAAGDAASVIDEDWADDILWEHTPFPVGTAAQVFKAMHVLFADGYLRRAVRR